MSEPEDVLTSANGSAPNGFRRLRVWRDAMDLAVEVYGRTREFPKHETYGLASQMQRAAVSIPSNIAEGNTRHHTAEYLHHVSIAKESLAEVETHLELTLRLGYVNPNAVAAVLGRCAEVGRQLNALRRYLEEHRSGNRQTKNNDYDPAA